MASDPRELLTANLALVERAIAFACRRYRLGPDDAEEFGSTVKLRLVEKDYAVLRAWEGRSSLTTFISTVVQRLALDYRIHTWGKWHASAEAKRLGALAVSLEQLLHRDHRTPDEALVILAPKYEGVTRESLAALAGRLPQRAPRHREVEIEEAASVAATPAADEPLLAEERRAISLRIASVLSSAIEKLPENERLVLQLRFEQGMTVAQIARALQIDQKLLYRRIERCTLDMRKELESSGIAAGDVFDVIGRSESLIDVDFGNHGPRPSIHPDETVATHSEGSQ